MINFQGNAIREAITMHETENKLDESKLVLYAFEFGVAAVAASVGVTLTAKDREEVWRVVAAVANGDATLCQSPSDVLAYADPDASDELKKKFVDAVRSRIAEDQSIAELLVAVSNRLKEYPPVN